MEKSRHYLWERKMVQSPLTGKSSKSLTQNYHRTQKLHFWVYTPNKWKQVFKKIHAHACSEQHSSPKPKGGDNSNVINRWLDGLWQNHTAFIQPNRGWTSNTCYSVGELLRLCYMKRGQTQKLPYYRIPFIRAMKEHKSTEPRWVAARGEAEGNWPCNEYGISSWGNENISELGRGCACTALWIH